MHSGGEKINNNFMKNITFRTRTCKGGTNSCNIANENDTFFKKTVRNDEFLHTVSKVLYESPRNTPKRTPSIKRYSKNENSGLSKNIVSGPVVKNDVIENNKITPNRTSNQSLESLSICRSCKIPFRTVVADVHCNNESDKSTSCSKCEINSICSDTTSDFSIFQPVCSSTKYGTESLAVSKTPCRSTHLPPNLQMSGVKELQTPKNKLEMIKEQFNLPADNIQQNYEINNLKKGSNSDGLNEEDDLPCTQPVSTIILRGVVAYVDVKMFNLKIDDLKSDLLSLGADIEEKFTRKVTHVIFRDGSITTYKKAKRWKIPLVSIVWLDQCKKELQRLPTDGYDPPGLEIYEKKLTKKPENDDIFDVFSNKKQTGRKLKRINREIQKQQPRKDNNIPVCGTSVTCDTPEDNSSKFNLFEVFINNLGSDIQDMINCSESPTEDFHIPVPISLIRKCITPRKVKTDIKELALKPVNRESSKISERRKNLDNLLKPCANNADKENSSEEYKSERRSAPSELYKSHKNIDKRKRPNVKVMEKDKGSCDAILSSNVFSSKKRQLLPIDQPIELLGDNTSLNTSHRELVNPYDSPKPVAKCRKNVQKNVPPLKKRQNCNTKVGLKNQFRRNSRSNDVEHNGTNSSRRSSQIFVSKQRKVTKEKFVPTIVSTGLQKPENAEFIYIAVDLLKYFEVETNVSQRTTHIIVDRENFRTINLLKGLVRGCWILDISWVISSLQARKWLSEEKFEITTFSPATTLNRYDRQAFGSEYICDLFKECGPFFVNPKCDPPAKDLIELITLCSGRVVSVCRAADTIVGGKPSLMYRTIHVSEKWVLDCITQNILLGYEDYSLHELQLS